MNIAIVSLQFEKTSTGGGGVHVEHVADQFLKLGQKVFIIAIHTKKTLLGVKLIDAEVPYSIETRGDLTVIRFLLDEGIEQPYVGTKEEELDRIMRFAQTAIKWIKEHDGEYDIVSLQGHHIIPGYIAKELTGKVKAKTVSYLHALETTYVTKDGAFVGAYEGTKEILGRIRKWESMCKYADIIIGNSPMVNEDFKEIIAESGDDPEKYDSKIKLIVSGCNERFIMTDDEVERKLKTKPEVIKLVTFCRIDPSKGIDYSIKGAKEAARLSTCNKFCLTIAGIPSSDGYIEQLKSEIKDVPENLEVKFRLFSAISPLEEKKSVLDEDHMYILPTLKEPFGMSLIEASARGNMAISADTNGPRYMFDIDSGIDEGWGVVTPRGILARITDDPPENFAQNVGKAIAYAADNWPQSVKRVLAFNDKIRHAWTWESIGQQYLDLFRSIV
ncbi:MAG: glycosyltransferase family 4 protein [Candidatus Omnitrophica bacterium]|nr:glycosyltransferase family 4 protein [Candidatus Omnitrophota bacterium]